MNKPTLGVMPKHIWLQFRFGELGYAIMDRIEARQSVPMEWLEEYNEIQKELANRNGNESTRLS